jgi:hypothetical protein
MKLAQNTLASASGKPAADPALLSALAGTDASRAGAVAYRTRRVVLSSLGVMQEQKEGRRRTRALALAGTLLMVLALSPFIWRVAEDLFAGEHFCDPATQFSLMICVFCPAMVAAFLVAGWLRRRS